MDAFDQTIFEFDGFTIDFVQRSLKTNGRELELRPKSFDVLTCLVENAGSVVNKDEIISSVWRNVVATDESLTQCIKDIRRALGSAGQRIVKTVPNRGYQLAATVTVLPRDSRAHGVARTGPAAKTGVALRRGEWGLAFRGRSILLSGMALAVAIAGAFALYLSRPKALPLPDRPSIAVLPFVNVGGDRAQDYFSEGISEDVTTSLSKFGELFVVAYNSAFTYGNRDVDVRDAGRKLGVRFILHGSVRRDGERVRITAHLVDAMSAREMWAESYDRDVTGIFSVQDDVTQRIVVTLVGHIGRSELNRAILKPAESLAAYDYYLRGKAESVIKFAGASPEGRRLFNQAIAVDPHYAPAVAALARNYGAAWMQPTDRPEGLNGEFQKQVTLDTALALAQRAVSLDPYLAEAHAELGWILHWQYRRGEALAEFERALALNPNLADGHYAILLIHAGRADDAIAFMKRVMRLDPFHRAVYFGYLGNAYFLTGEYDKSIELHRMTAARVPEVVQVHIWHAATAAQLGLNDEARKAAAEVLRLQPGFRITRFLEMVRLARQADADLLGSGLRKAGLPN